MLLACFFFPTRLFCAPSSSPPTPHHLHYHHLRRHRLHSNHHSNQKYYNYYRCDCADATNHRHCRALIKWQWFMSPRLWLCSLRLDNRWTLLTAHVWRLLKCRLQRTEQLRGHGPCFRAGPCSSIIHPLQLSPIRPGAPRPSELTSVLDPRNAAWSTML